MKWVTDSDFLTGNYHQRCSSWRVFSLLTNDSALSLSLTFSHSTHLVSANKLRYNTNRTTRHKKKTVKIWCNKQHQHLLPTATKLKMCRTLIIFIIITAVVVLVNVEEKQYNNTTIKTTTIKFFDVRFIFMTTWRSPCSPQTIVLFTCGQSQTHMLTSTFAFSFCATDVYKLRF